MTERSPFVVTWRNALRDDRKLSAKAKLVGYTLAQHTNGNGKNAFPSYEKIAEETSLSRASVAAGIKELVERKWVVRKSGSGEVHPNVYELRRPPSASWTLPRGKAPSKSRRGTVQHLDAKESKARRKSKPFSQGTNQEQAVGEETRARAEGVDAETEDGIRGGRANDEVGGAVVVEMDSHRSDDRVVELIKQRRLEREQAEQQQMFATPGLPPEERP